MVFIKTNRLNYFFFPGTFVPFAFVFGATFFDAAFFTIVFKIKLIMYADTLSVRACYSIQEKISR
jgi:hypothetical protein